MLHVIVQDQQGAHPPRHAHVLDWLETTPCTLRLLIEERVSVEHDRMFRNPEYDYANHFIQYRRDQPITLQQAIKVAIDGFHQNAFFVIVDGHQLVDIDMPVNLRGDTEITFVKLLPLQGG